jgi:hypothetical protein
VEICTVGSVRGESVGAAMVDLNGHEAGNGGYSQGKTYSTPGSPLLGEMSGNPCGLRRSMQHHLV